MKSKDISKILSVKVMLKFKIAVGFIIGSFALTSIATPPLICNRPQEKWMNESDLQHLLIRKGFLIGTIKIVNGCYEFYGLDPRGRRIQILIDPETAKPIVDRDAVALPTGS